MRPPKGIGYEIKSLSNLIKQCIDTTVSESGMERITSMQGLIIRYLYHHEASFQHDLEKEFTIRRSTATGILQRMERDGLITREPLQSDARRKKILLTPKAIGMHQNVICAIIQVEKKITDGLSNEETDTFLKILDKIKANLS